jgi:hypothetical protein
VNFVHIRNKIPGTGSLKPKTSGQKQELSLGLPMQLGRQPPVGEHDGNYHAIAE